ncbi:MAG: PD-(D/E)XK nuclease family protein [Vampirovibrionales bacterium]
MPYNHPAQPSTHSDFICTKPLKLSVNHLKTWDKCQRRFELHSLRQLQWPSDPSNFVYGQSVHTLMDYQSRQLDCQPLLNSADAKIRQAWDWLIQEETSQWPVIASEWGFTVPAPNHPLLKHVVLVGRIDRISQGPDDSVVIVDWKTGTAIPKNPSTAWQTNVYLYAVYHSQKLLGLSGLTPEKLRFRYVSVNQGIKTVDIPYDDEAHTRVCQQLTHTLVNLVTATHYSLPPQCPDRFCAYQYVCGINAINIEKQPL